MRSVQLMLVTILLGCAEAQELDFSDPQRAEPQLESLVKEWEQEASQNPDADSHVGLAESLLALGIIERQIGKPQEAIEHLERASKLFQKYAPNLTPDALEAFAIVKQDVGDFEASEALLREVVETRRDGAPEPLANSLDHLALNLLAQGRYLEAFPTIRSALEVAPKSNLVLQAKLLSHLGRAHHTLGSHTKSAQLFQSALDKDFNDPSLRLALRSQLALSQLRLGLTNQAMEATEAVADDARRLFENMPLQAIPYLNNLGALALALGRYEEARAAFSEALEMIRSKLGDEHPGLIGPQNNLGVTLQKLGDLQSARQHLMDARELQLKFLPSTHLRVAETQTSLAVNSLLQGSDDAEIRCREATQTGLELLSHLVTGGTERERLNFLERFDLVSLPCAMGDAELIADTLIASKARLLDVMISKSPPNEAPTWKRVRNSLPKGSAFIDYCQFRALDDQGTLQYGAIVIAPDVAPQWVPLGNARELHQWLDLLKRRLDWNAAILTGETTPAPPLRMAGILKALSSAFWDPIEAALPTDTQNLAVSPAGGMHFVPFSALIAQDDSLLCQRYQQLTGVSSGRDLLKTTALPPIDSAPWAVLTISDFPKPDEPSTEDTLTELLAGLESMPGTAREERLLKELAPDDSLFLRESEATEKNLAALPTTPAVLHLGCHAFFLGDGLQDADVTLDFDESTNLFQSSGLVLHRGALRASESNLFSPSDDVLFPTEIAQLPLTTTRLVTLSSCESGSGTPVNGEGLLGLKRAFAIAGAKEVAVALWPISDQSTPEFMQRFYELASHSNRPAQSLWQAQREHLTEASSADFETAVLRYAPFFITQSHGLEVGEEIRPPRSQFSWWKVAAGIPLLMFVWVKIRHHKRIFNGSHDPERKAD